MSYPARAEVLVNMIKQSKAQHIRVPTTATLPTTLETFFSLNYLGHIVYMPQTNIYQNIMQLLITLVSLLVYKGVLKSSVQQKKLTIFFKSLLNFFFKLKNDEPSILLMFHDSKIIAFLVMVRTIQHLSSSSSSSYRAGSTDIPDPLSPLLPIVHRPRQVFRTTSCILTQLLNVRSCWSSCFCAAVCGDP